MESPLVGLDRRLVDKNPSGLRHVSWLRIFHTFKYAEILKLLEPVNKCSHRNQNSYMFAKRGVQNRLARIRVPTNNATPRHVINSI